MQTQVNEQALTRFFGPELARPEGLSAANASAKTLWRPFSAFPHAWIAVETLAGYFANELQQSSIFLDERIDLFKDGQPLPRSDGPIPKAQALEWMAQSEVHALILAEAEAWIAKAQSRGLATAPSATDKAAFWEWWQATLERSDFYLEKRYDRS